MLHEQLVLVLGELPAKLTIYTSINKGFQKRLNQILREEKKTEKAPIPTKALPT